MLWTEGFGHADVERRVPATPDTLYHIASVTKTFTAILVLQLVEQGKLDLDAPVSRYVPGIKAGWISGPAGDRKDQASGLPCAPSPCGTRRAALG